MASPPNLSADEAVALLERAFAGVTLGTGISLRQAELIDDMEYQIDHRYAEVRAGDVVDDWRRIPDDDIDRLCYLAHIDAEGFRYYLPALLCSVIRSYDDTTMRVIQTLSALSPDVAGWDYYMQRFSVLNVQQMNAVALVLHRLPTLVDLAPEDATIVSRALRNYWNHFLPGAAGAQPH